jgi:hypothetical protein
VQLLPLGQSDKVARIDRDQYSAFGDGTAPDHMVGLPDEATIPHVTNVMPSLGERANCCWGDILVQDQASRVRNIGLRTTNDGMSLGVE